MRLLHTTKFTFKEFIGQNIPPYAILSHRWSEQEVSHQDFLASKQSPLQRKSEGYGWLKIPKGCQIAVQDGFEWMWIDTCCIDKKSSAELSEAINSMFAWYRGSKICYVFHPDVHATGGFNYGPNEPEFRGSSWFTRAWTLQELIAPRKVLFFNSDFRKIGDKVSLRDSVEAAAGFEVPSPDMIGELSIGERMRWASKRTATRSEDLAYSLLGVFGINMPLLYGEGDKAFYRLQLEIIRQSTDESIFAWRATERPYSITTRALIARDASYFSNALDSKRYPFISREHFEVTNQGIRITCNFPKDFLRRITSKTEDRSATVLEVSEGAKIIMPLNILGLKRNSGRGRALMLVPFLEFTVFPDLSQSRKSKRPVKYFHGLRDALIVAELDTWDILDIKRAVQLLHSPTSRGWDAICGEEDDEHTAVPVYFK